VSENRRQGAGFRRQRAGDRGQEADMAVQNVKELTVYKKAYFQAMRYFEISNRFPQEERYALTGQGRRSSRSVSQNLREAWAKRRYEAHFVSKLTDCDGENGETDTCWDFALDCGYISTGEHAEVTGLNQEVGKMLGSMIANPKRFLLTPDP
jgi:four helix bundle protein